jgi:hypothetical protein
MPTKVSAAMTTGVVKDTDKASKTGGLVVEGQVVQLNSTGKIPSTFTSGGINLGGTGAANLLDDYEVGTFTLTMRGSSGSSGSAAGNTATCSYVKVGKLVYFNGAFNLTNVGSYSGNLLFTGLPFTVDGENHPMPLGGHQLDSDNETKNYLYFITANNTTIDVANPNVSGAIGWSSVGTGAYQINGTYITT